MRLKDKVAFLTGAAGAGIGQSTARLLAKEGARIVITDAHQERSRAVAQEIAKDLRVDTLGIGCDVTQREAVEAAVQTALDAFGRIDILVATRAQTGQPLSSPWLTRRGTLCSTRRCAARSTVAALYCPP